MRTFAVMLSWTLALFIFVIIITGLGYVCVWAFISYSDNSEESLRLDLHKMRKHKQSNLELYCSKNTNRLVLLLKGSSDVHSLTLTMTDIDAEGISSLTDIPCLRRLELYAGPKIDDNALARLSRLPVLEELILRNCHITNSGIIALKRLDHLRRITIYQDSTNSILLSDDVVDILKDFTKLVEIRLVGGWLSEQGLQRLKNSRPDCLVTTSESARSR